MSKKPTEDRSGWLNPKKDSPSPNTYFPKIHSSTIPITFPKGTNPNDHHTPGPGPVYDPPSDPNTPGPRWVTPNKPSKPSAKKQVPSSESNESASKNDGKVFQGGGNSLTRMTPSGHLMGDDRKNEPQPSNNPNQGSPLNVRQNPDYTKVGGQAQPSWPTLDLVNNRDDQVAVLIIGTPDDHDRDRPYPSVDGSNQPTFVKPVPRDIELHPRRTLSEEQYCPETNQPNGSAIFLPVPPNPSPFSWLTNGKLSILGVICASGAFLSGIIHLGLWHSSGTCIFSGVWLVVWGLLILITEGMLLPKITLFNQMEFFYPMTSLINSRPFWIKTIFYAVIAIIAIAVCAKWTTGLGGGLLVLLSLSYGLKQIDQNYQNRQHEFERIHRRSNVPVWAIT